jgi:hypothetical protein
VASSNNNKYNPSPRCLACLLPRPIYTLNSIISNSLMLLFLLYLKNPRKHIFSIYISLLIVTCSSNISCFPTLKVIHQRIQTTHSRTSQYHHYDVDFVLFLNNTCYTNSLLSRIHVNFTLLLNITCTFDSTRMII